MILRDTQDDGYSKFYYSKDIAFDGTDHIYITGYVAWAEQNIIDHVG